MSSLIRVLCVIGFTFGVTFAITCDRAAAAQSESRVSEDPINLTAIVIFFAFLALTLFITWWAAKRTRNREAFYTASGGIPAWQNGLAIAGDFMSAATFLGITGLMFVVGYDAYILSFGILVGWPIMLMLIAERFRNLGKFTFVDVITFRLEGNAVRLLAAFSSLSVVMMYLIGQMVGAGKLIELLFGVDYFAAVIMVSVLMIFYVMFGGMIATTWVQMIKAVLLLSGGLYLGGVIMAQFGFDFSKMIQASADIHPKGAALLHPGGWLKGDILNVSTVALTMCFGIMGLPHILMRFFTVRNAAAARASVTVATLIMALFYLLILIIGFGAVAIIWGDERFYDASGALMGGGNMVALHTAKALGGDVVLGFMSAVSFATILAVVAGLTLAGAATIAHDILSVRGESSQNDQKQELQISRLATVGVGAAALLLGLAFENQNIAVVTALALAIAASVNFPLLLLSMYWKGMTSKGAVRGGAISLFVSVVLIILSDSVWVKLLGNETAIFPYLYPTIVTMPLAFLLVFIFSVLDKSAAAARERSRFHEQYIRSETGLGAFQAKLH